MLTDKTILVTGAASGIGAAAARVFARYGARVLVTDRDLEGARAVAAGLPGAVAAELDVTDAAGIETVIALAARDGGRLDGALNNAGIPGDGGRPNPLADYPEREFDGVLSVNVRGAWLCMRAEVRAMLADGHGGAIVNTASVLGTRAAPGMAAYVASKHALIGLTRSAALDYARLGIRVNAVLPGVVDTPMIALADAAQPGYRDGAAAHHPMGRLTRPEEVGEAAAWLLSDRASATTGALLNVDLGLSAQA